MKTYIPIIERCEVQFLEPDVDITKKLEETPILFGQMEIEQLTKIMEEMAGDRSEHGKREPGERQAREIYNEKYDKPNRNNL